MNGYKNVLDLRRLGRRQLRINSRLFCDVGHRKSCMLEACSIPGPVSVAAVPVCYLHLACGRAQHLLSFRAGVAAMSTAAAVSTERTDRLGTADIRTVWDKKRGFLRISSATGKKWESVIGLEVHAQINAASKLFSSAPTSYNQPVNSQVSYFDAAIPGTLPVLNARCVEAGVITGLALGSTLNLVSFFDRKHYFYADLPAGYQITQQRRPIAQGGHLTFPVKLEELGSAMQQRTVDIIQIQIEQDSGKSLHEENDGKVLVDLNRCGIGLLELVFAPTLQHGEEAAALGKELGLILDRIGASRARMERGELRIDANISVREPGAHLGVRTEVKNLNSLRSVARAVEYEVARQIRILESGGQVENETRGFDFATRRTVSMRDKEKKQDYRFMPEPNLPPLRLTQQWVDRLAHNMPELPQQTRQRLVNEYGLKLEVVSILVDFPSLLQFFQDCMKLNPSAPKVVAEVILTIIQEYLNETGGSVADLALTPAQLVECIEIRNNKEISFSTLRLLLLSLLTGDERRPRTILEAKSWYLIRDPQAIQKFVSEFCIGEHELLVTKYLKAKPKRRDQAYQALLNEINKNELCERMDMSQVNPLLRKTLDAMATEAGN